MAGHDDLSIRADSIFAAALDLTAGERQGFVDRECSEDPDLKSLVERLLANVETDGDLFTGGVMDGPLWQQLAKNLAREPDLTGSIVDRYRILREVGRGGMAVVYLAERADSQFDQQVALKLIKRGTDTDEVIRRFRQERQIMALTQHPNIARLFDGGATADGRPYFVMEYVAGRSIDRYCDEQRLTIRKRLALFLRVARAIDHAHRNLVVHRDIKPSNILVSLEGEVKLLDFGIAKFLDPGADPRLTRSQMRFLTPAYASPEQVKGIPATPASDIYQLGLLLYLLITGHSPYRRGASPSREDLAKIITEEPPTRPSTVVDASRIARSENPSEVPDAVAVSQSRGTTPGRLRRELDGDLDNIVLMALRKEPERRYASTAHLMDDIERHLQGLPVIARPNTFRYRAGKFVRRHALAVVASLLMVTMVTGLVAFYTVQLARERDRANQEAERASREAAVAVQVTNFLIGIFEVSDPSEARGNRVTAREILDQGAERLAEELEDEPLTKARLMKTIGRVYRNLGLFEPAESFLEQTLALLEESATRQDPEVVDGLNELGGLYRQLGRLAEAEALYQRAQRLLEGQDDPEGLAELNNNLAQLYLDQGRLAESEELFNRSLEVLEAHRGPDDSSVAEVLNNLGLLVRTDRRPAEAVPLFQRALPIMETNLGSDHPHVAITLNNLALAFRDQKEYATAQPLYERSLVILEKLLGPDHPHVAVALHNLADLHADQAHYDEAEALYQRSREILEASLGPEHPNVATSLHSLADLYFARQELDLAEATHRRSLAIREQALGVEHPLVAQALEGLALVLEASGSPEKARELEARASAIRDKSRP